MEEVETTVGETGNSWLSRDDGKGTPPAGDVDEGRGVEFVDGPS